MPSVLLSLSFLISCIGLLGICIRRDTFVFLFINIELVLIGLGFGYCMLSYFLVDGSGYLMALAIITVTAVEAAIGLGLLVLYYNLFQSTTITQLAYYLRG